MCMSENRSLSIVGAIPKILVGIVFLLIGLFILGINVLFFVTSKDYVKTIATVADKKNIDGEMTNILKYEANGKVYMEEDILSSDLFDVGEEVNIAYNPDNPKQYNIGDTNDTGMGLIMSLLSIIFGILALVSGVKDIKNKKSLIGVYSYDTNMSEYDKKRMGISDETGISFDINEKN